MTPGAEREVDDALGKDLIKHGLAVEVKPKATPAEKITDKEDNES